MSPFYVLCHKTTRPLDICFPKFVGTQHGRELLLGRDWTFPADVQVLPDERGPGQARILGLLMRQHQTRIVDRWVYGIWDGSCSRSSTSPAGAVGAAALDAGIAQHMARASSPRQAVLERRLPAPTRWSYHPEVRGVLVDLKDDAEGWVPLEVEYRPASAGLPMEYQVIERHPELASARLRIAQERAARLAARLHVVHILHQL